MGVKMGEGGQVQSYFLREGGELGWKDFGKDKMYMLVTGNIQTCIFHQTTLQHQAR